jgi:hypothetical protein
MTYKGVVRLLLAGVLTLCLLSPVWAKGPPSAQDDGKGKANGQTKLKGWRFAVFGDHRGDNKNYNATLDGYKDGGYNKAVLTDLATAIKGEDVEFALDVGDLVTKWKKDLNITADLLLTKELAEWADTWNKASGNLPIYPVRGNQEVTASIGVWLAFTAGMPGIGDHPLNGPPGEEGLTFAFTHKNCLFVGIDQYADPRANGDTHVVSPEAQAWLDALLAASDRPHTFVFGHAPAYETWTSAVTKPPVPPIPPFTVVKDGLATPYAKFTSRHMEMRDAFWSSLGLVGAEYFCGHEHMYGRGVTTEAAVASLRQNIIGNGGAPLVPLFPDAYAATGVYCESYTDIALPVAVEDPPLVVNLKSPLIRTEAAARTGEVGYIVVQVHGSKVTAKYVAALADIATNKRIGPFIVVDTWTIAEGDDEEEVEEPEEEEAEAATR